MGSAAGLMGNGMIVANDSAHLIVYSHFNQVIYSCATDSESAVSEVMAEAIIILAKNASNRKMSWIPERYPIQLLGV